MRNYLIVFLGAGIGGAMRHAINQAAARLFLSGLPYGTLFINIVGSLAIGMVAGYFALRGQAPQSLRLFLTTGIIGGFTTFSAFSLEVALLHQRGETLLALGYAVASVVLSVGALFAGMWLMRHLSS